MSAGNGKGQPTNVKEFLQELRSNRKTQGMAVVFVLVLAWTVWMVWPEQKQARPRPGTRPAAAAAVSATLGDQQAKLEKLPDLAKAAGASELPKTTEMARDLFLFDAPQRLPDRYEIYVEPPPPPTEAEKKAAEEKAARDFESSTRPAGVRFIGFIVSKQGQAGAFMKGDEPVILPLGDLGFKGWKLVKLDDTGAEFQNLRFPDLRHKLQPTDGAGPGGPTHVRNEF